MTNSDLPPYTHDVESDLLGNRNCIEIVRSLRLKAKPPVEIIQINIEKLKSSGQFEKEMGFAIPITIESCEKLLLMFDDYLEKIEGVWVSAVDCKSLLGVLKHDLLRWYNLLVGGIELIYTGYPSSQIKSLEFDAIFDILLSARDSLIKLFRPSWRQLEFFDET